MTKYSATTLDATFAALSDPIRRGVLERLAQGEATVGELAAPFRVSSPTISHHLRVLESARLISRTKRGRTHICRVRPSGIRAAAGWIAQYEQFWLPRLDALGDHLDRTKADQ